MDPLIALISYQWNDSVAAEFIHEELALRGFKVIHDRCTFLHGSRLPTNMADAVARCDVFVAYLTRSSLYLEAPTSAPRPAVDDEFLPAMQRRRRSLADGGAARPVVAAITHGLGDPRSEAPTVVRETTGEDISSLWNMALDQSTEHITQLEAADLASRVLSALLAPASGQDQEIVVTVVTRGTGQPSTFLTVDATSTLGGAEHRPGDPQDWRRYFQALRDIESALAAWGPARRLRIDPRTHLTGAVTIGRVFNQSGHWDLQVVGRAGTAGLSDAAAHDQLAVTWERIGAGHDMAIHIDLLGHPVSELATQLARSLPPLAGRLDIARRDPTGNLTSTDVSDMANVAASAIRRAVTDTRAQNLHLFVASPAEFAVLLGHRMTALHADLHLYERTGDSYVPTLLIPAATP
jgi:hypothetical protein